MGYSPFIQLFILALFIALPIFLVLRTNKDKSIKTLAWVLFCVFFSWLGYFIGYWFFKKEPTKTAFEIKQ